MASTNTPMSQIQQYNFLHDFDVSRLDNEVALLSIPPHSESTSLTSSSSPQVLAESQAYTQLQRSIVHLPRLLKHKTCPPLYVLPPQTDKVLEKRRRKAGAAHDRRHKKKQETQRLLERLAHLKHQEAALKEQVTVLQHQIAALNQQLNVMHPFHPDLVNS